MNCLILGVKDSRIREKLLGKRLDLDKAIEITKASQVTNSRVSEIAGEASVQKDVNPVKHKTKPHRKSGKVKFPKSSTRNYSSDSKPKECLFCGVKVLKTYYFGEVFSSVLKKFQLVSSFSFLDKHL